MPANCKPGVKSAVCDCLVFNYDCLSLLFSYVFLQFRRIMFLAAGIVLTNTKIFSAMCVCDDCFVIAAAVQSSSL